MRTYDRFRLWLVDDQFGPRRKRRFALRVRLRVLFLTLKLWWGGVSLGRVLFVLPRPMAVLIVGFGLPILAIWVASIAFPEEMGGLGATLRRLLLGGEQVAQLEWRAAIQPLLILIGVPAAFILWAFRDFHVKATLENQRKDVNLKEFQEIQMRAAGAMDEKLPAAAREAMQIAALHQLRAFLRGEYGASFRRPAFELLRARMTASATTTGTNIIADWVAKWHDGDEGANRARHDGPAGQAESDMAAEIRGAFARLRPSPVSDAELAVIHEEWRAVFRTGLPLVSTIFDRIHLPRGALLARLDLTRCRFVHAELSGAHLEGAILISAHFEGARLEGAHLEGANLEGAHFEGADLREACLGAVNLSGVHLEGADLTGAFLEGADLRRAHLQGAVLVRANLRGADLRWARLDGADLDGANLVGANLFEAHLEDASLRFVKLHGANFGWAHLEGANLQWSRLEVANWRRADIKGAKLTPQQLENLDLGEPKKAAVPSD